MTQTDGAGSGTEAPRPEARTRFGFLRGFTTRIINPLTRRFAGSLPGFGILTYRGRKSGRLYRTPINYFRHGDDYVFALTYGSQTQWVKNVLAAGGCEMRTRGRDIRLRAPELIVDPDLKLIPRGLRLIGNVNHVTEVVRMRAV